MFMIVLMLGVGGVFSYAEPGYWVDNISYTPEKRLHIVDRGSHYPSEFKKVVTDVCRQHSSYSTSEVADSMILAYQEIQKDQPKITMYEVSEDIRRNSQDELGIDLVTYIVAYVRSQTP